MNNSCAHILESLPPKDIDTTIFDDDSGYWICLKCHAIEKKMTDAEREKFRREITKEDDGV